MKSSDDTEVKEKNKNTVGKRVKYTLVVNEGSSAHGQRTMLTKMSTAKPAILKEYLKIHLLLICCCM